MVRLFGLQDVLLLRRLRPRCVGFDLRRLLLDAPSPMSSALLDYFSHHHLGAITCVREDMIDGKSLWGFAQVWPRPDRPEWDLGCLAPALTSNGDADLWRGLLNDLVLFGVERGILRIYARASEDAQTEDVLRQAGFTVITREEVFALSHCEEPASRSRPAGLRPVSSQDGWALSELYRQAVPQLVRRTEELPTRLVAAAGSGLPALTPTDEYVWAEEGRIIAHLGLCRSPKGYWLEVVALPRCRADTSPHIQYMLSLAMCSPRTPVYCPVPDYAAGLGQVLRALGFEAYARQVLLVLHTAARVPVRRPRRVMGLEGRADVRTPLGHISPEECGQKP